MSMFSQATEKQILIFLLFSGLVFETITAQPDRTGYFVLNIPPLSGSTVELGYEVNFSPNLAFELNGGYLINTSVNSPVKILTEHNFERKSGFFVMPGVRFNIRRDPGKFAPFIGVNLINSIAIEQGVYYDNFPDSEFRAGSEFSNTSYNLGFTGVIGLTTSSTARVSFDMGIRAGKLLVDNLVDFHSYMPGMGVGDSSGWRTLGVPVVDIGARYSLMARLKYRIK
jgi:hypothetical protein